MQQSVVASLSYPQYLLAAAGTGKTEVLIQKIIHILLEDEFISLKNFGIITFTNKATDEMRNRLRDGLYRQWYELLLSNNMAADRIRRETEITSMVNINTIHGFCEGILRQYGLSIGLSLNFKIKSFRYEAMRIIEDEVNKHHSNSLFKNIPIYRIVKLILILTGECENKGIRINRKIADSFDFSSPENEFWNEFKALFIDILISSVERIEKAKSTAGILTANDLISKVVLLLNQEYIVKRIAGQYKYIFIDEFQDTNKDQFNFVKILADNGVKVFLVGDDKQSVYAFRGADIENSKEMNEYIQTKLSHKDEMVLNENFRSDETLIHAVNKIFSYKFMFDGKEVKFPTVSLAVPNVSKGSGETHPVRTIYGSSIPKILESVLKEKINDRDVSYGDIAILCRRNYDLDTIGSDLRKKGYPVEIIGGKGFFRSKEVIDTYKLFNAVLYNDDEHINELLFTDYFAAMQGNAESNSFHMFFEKLKSAFRLETVESLFAIIFDETRILEFYRGQKRIQSIYNLLKLRDKSREMMNTENLQPLQFLDYMRIMIMTKQDEDDAEIPEEERTHGIIRLYTIHKAKGLSFPIVIVPCLDNKLNRPITIPKVMMDLKSMPPRLSIDSSALSDELPFDRDYEKMLSLNQIKQLEEEVRIFYVACTRAEHKLILSSNKSLDEVKRTLKWDSYASVMKWLVCMKENSRAIPKENDKMPVGNKTFKSIYGRVYQDI